MLKRMGIFTLVVVVAMISIVSCDLLKTHSLGGTWSISTTPTAGFDYGSGSASLSFSYTNKGVDLYEGSGTIGGISYYIAMGHNPDTSYMNWDFALASSGMSNDYIIGFGTYTAGNPVTGDYSGYGAWSSDYGTFTSTKQ
jgi:hypothetical protein